MIFLTVGTQFAFDRLVKGVDEAVESGSITEEIYAQIGESSYKPRNFKAVKSLDKNIFDSYLHQASYIVSHAGMGTITMALDNNKPLLVMPRQKKYGEVVNDHQVAIAREFEKFGHILAAYKQEDLSEKIQKLKSFIPQPRSTSPELVINRIAQFLNHIKDKHGNDKA